jgi:hypothetical protein
MIPAASFKDDLVAEVSHLRPFAILLSSSVSPPNPRLPHLVFEKKDELAQGLKRSTITSIVNAVSSLAEFTSRDALPHWPSGAPWRRLAMGVSRHARSTAVTLTKPA